MRVQLEHENRRGVSSRGYLVELPLLSRAAFVGKPVSLMSGWSHDEKAIPFVDDHRFP